MAKQEENKFFSLTSFLYGGNADYMDELYAAYEKNPNSVDAEWREFFASLHDEKADVLKNAEGASWQRQNWPRKPEGELVAALDGNWAAAEAAKDKGKAPAKNTAENANAAANPQAIAAAALDCLRAQALIEAYRRCGHLRAQIDPLRFAELPNDYRQLDPEYYGFTAADYDRPIFINGALGLQTASLRQIVEKLRQLYCGAIGAEFMHISDPEQRAWVEEKLSAAQRFAPLAAADKKRLLARLVETEGFEAFLDTKYKGIKRFGLNGGEALVSALDAIISRSAALGTEEFMFGMAHRGRLNVLTQILGKPHRAVFHEFKGGSSKPDSVAGSGDVKYHLGASADGTAAAKNVHLSLLPNPSHLEIVNPIVLGKARARQAEFAVKEGLVIVSSLLDGQESDKALADKDVHLSLNPSPAHLEIVDPIVLGRARARQDDKADAARSKVLPILMHGDAAFAGQGVVAETFALSNLRGYTVGGQVHIIINNQVGFTTGPANARSGVYASDLAKTIEAPIFHVNGDDPEAVEYVAAIAAEYRHKFRRPVVIDMVCYRRYGHNEGDEPSFTQPLMYKNIRAHKDVVTLYGEKLIAEGIVSAAELEAQKKAWHEKMEAEFEAEYRSNKAQWLEGLWADMRAADGSEEQSRGKTGVSEKKLEQIGNSLTEIPQGFNLHRTVQRFIDNRKKMLETKEGLDWATAEALAFGSLMLDGSPIRLSGEDVERGTFSQRHSVFYDQETQEAYIPLNHLAEKQALYEPVNSLLSEEAVLAYEYGHSLVNPRNLTLWEAQFGDFANGAQMVFDQFISSSETKWLRMSGLVCLLPHGFEGQGPEHSSARPERFLQLCAEDNMQVANCTTPANYFHILRRQIERDFRKPLVIMTPKSLLRHKRAVSSLKEMAEGTYFQPILADDAERLKKQAVKLQPDTKIRRVILCTGKVYYDLYEEREKRGLDDIYIIRIEQLYPFPAQALAGFLQRFKQAEIIWCQEEPKNMGAWSFITPYAEWVLRHIGVKAGRIHYVGRPAAAAPAAGLAKDHQLQLAAFLEEAMSKQKRED